MVAFNEVLYDAPRAAHSAWRLRGVSATVSPSAPAAAAAHHGLYTRPGAALGVRVMTGPPFTHTFRNCPDKFIVDDQTHPTAPRAGSAASARAAQCTYRGAPEFLSTSWKLERADAYVERHCAGYGHRDPNYVEHKIKCAGGGRPPFAVMHKATLQVQPPAATLAVQPPTATLAVQPPTATLAVQPLTATLAVQPAAARRRSWLPWR